MRISFASTLQFRSLGNQTAAPDSGREVSGMVSRRAGGTENKEQNAFVYRKAMLDAAPVDDWPEPDDNFEREPTVTPFEADEGRATRESAPTISDAEDPRQGLDLRLQRQIERFQRNEDD